VESQDSCGNGYLSDSVRTIKLSGNDQFNFINELRWNDFEHPNGTVSSYTLYREDAGAFNSIAILPPGTGNYLDDVTSFITDTGAFCYRIDADFTLDIPAIGLNENLLSQSNVFCIGQRAKIYAPNAIVPNGVNNIFKPVIVFGDAATYSLSILNKWGGVIYETNNIDDGWDGTYKGEIVPMGVYGYVIQFTATNGQNITKKGSVMVVR
jgi:gliding motility-associated-like protein